MPSQPVVLQCGLKRTAPESRDLEGVGNGREERPAVWRRQRGGQTPRKLLASWKSAKSGSGAASWAERDDTVIIAAAALRSGHPAASELYKLIAHSQVIG
jgi:hypothetical protein